MSPISQRPWQEINKIKTHDNLIEILISKMLSEGFTSIKADHVKGYVRPDQICDYIPDVTGFSGKQFYICEAESAEAIADDHTLRQWTAFYNAAVKAKGVFVAVVNVADRAKATRLMATVAKDSAFAKVIVL